MHGTFQYVRSIRFQMMKTMFHIHKNFIVTNKHLVCLHGIRNTKKNVLIFKIKENKVYIAT